MNIIGIDPGLSGGIAILRAASQVQHNKPEVEAARMPTSGGEIDPGMIAAWLRRSLAWEGGENIAYVEKVGAMPKQGLSSTFKFGKGYGQVLGVLATLDIPVQLVTPQAWKKVVLAGTAKDKDAAIAYCRQRWPSVDPIPPGCRVPSDGIADALCIAEYGRRQA